jgi:GWxTD domain-containing protein
MKLTISILILSFIFSINIFSQLPKNYILDNEVFYTNIIAIPSYNQDSIDVLLYYTFFYSGLVFQKINDNKYFAIPELEATFKDNEGIIRKRFISNDTIFVSTFEQTQEKSYYSNFIQFHLANNDYKIVCKLNNLKQRPNPIEYAVFKYSNKNKLKNMFILNFENPNYKPFYSNNCVPFDASSFSIFIPVVKSDNKNYNYTIEKQESKNNELNWATFDKIQGKFELIKDAIFEMKNNELQLVNTTDSENMSSFITANISMNQHNFTQGKYVLTITNSDIQQQFDFEIKWYNMPKSLLDYMYAVEQMYLILTDEEYKQIKNSDKNEIFSNIFKYWKRHDPTPTTEYNEAMAEFFNRVDYAEINFRTLTQKEGAKSDRGKIYILNGKPDEITTTIKDKKTNEVWSYKKLNKKYIFEIVSVGNYKLVKIEE